MNITYLLGAGASYNALPVVEKIPERLNSFADQFKLQPLEWLIENQQKSRISEKYILNITDSEIQKREFGKIKTFLRDILWLKDESEKHSSIDTFAKKLYLQGQKKSLEKLKFILSCFFLYEQTLRFDRRYDSFYASILDNISTLPDNLKILSWNYDSQLEIGYSNFTYAGINHTRKALNVITKGIENISEDQKNKFAIYKLNGTTNFIDDKNEPFDLIPNFEHEELSLLEDFLEMHSSQILQKKYNCSLSFAWENFNKNSYFNKNLSESIKETDILIIIGYSFPFFNRKIDEFILDSMPKLKKVYVQDPKYSNEIIEKIKGLKPWQLIKISGGGFEKKVVTKDVIEFIPKTFTDQFFIPIEF